ncbi:ribonuclease Z [Oceanobacillus sp. CAU 1775]
MHLTFLGTGAGVPSKERNVASFALSLLQEENQVWLFDCGEATQHQILYTSIKPRKINKIFITHLHGDHIYGLPGFLSSRSFQGGNDLLTVYGPKGIKKFIETTLSISKTHLNYSIEIVEIEDGFKIIEDNFTIYVKLLDHGIPSFGYRIEEKNTPGELLVHKLKALGIEPGPIYGQLKNNAFIETDEHGRLYRKDFIGPDKVGKIITVFGDTRYKIEHIDFALNADVLVHEATFNASQSDLAKKYYHSTTKEAASIARDAKVKRLVMTHISSRFQSVDSKALLKEAMEIFPHTSLANDFYTIEI